MIRRAVLLGSAAVLCVAQTGLAQTDPPMEGPGGFTIGGGGDDYGLSVAVNSSNGLLLGGQAKQTVTFDAGLPTARTLPPGGLIARFGPDSRLLWAQTFGVAGTDGAAVHGVGLDAAGNGYFAGEFPDSIQIGGVTLRAGRYPDLFVGKADFSGTILWVRQITTDGGAVWGLTVDPAGNMAVVGQAYGSAVFNLGQADSIRLTSPSSPGFVAAYDPSGQLRWVRPDGVISEGVALDTNGDVLVSGYDHNSLFISRYSAAGDLRWRRVVSNVGERLVLPPRARSVAVDPSGNAWVAGVFGSTVRFGEGEPRDTTIQAGSRADHVFLASYDPAGAFRWARTVTDGPRVSQTYGVVADRFGNGTLVARFDSTVTVGAGQARATTLTTAGGLDVLLAQYGPTGQLNWARRAGGTEDDFGGTLATNGSSLWVTGYFSGAATFGAGQPNELVLTSMGGLDLFLARYDNAGVLLPVELTGWTAARVGADVSLRWTTASEKQNAGFTVERQTDRSATWTALEFIPGAGTTVEAQRYGWTDRSAPTGAVRYRLVQHDLDGAEQVLPTVELNPTAAPTAFTLRPASPNPFNPATTMQFDLPLAATVTATAYDALGRAVQTLLPTQPLTAGSHTLRFDGTGLSSGVYMVRVTAVGGSGRRDVQTQRVLLAK